MKLVFSQEVRSARSEGRPLVGLETSVVAQGLPYPQNLEAARACEEAVRRAGAVPAAIALLDGEIAVGLEPEQMRRLAEPQSPVLKVASRDLALAVAQRRSGGTTVSATCEICAQAGIRVFATGGIGGVHRGVAEHGDVSQDLWALSRFPVGVVCAGAKSILDLPRTLEALESLGVPVVGVGTHELPGFYTQGSGLPLEHRVDSPQEAAAVLRERLDGLGQAGLVFALPPPAWAALPRSEVELSLAQSLEAAQAQGVRGKALTPFLLGELVKRTGGKTLRANLALLVHNAEFAGALALAYADLKS